MYLLKFENDMGYDGGVTTVIVGIAEDKTKLEKLSNELNTQIIEYNKKLEEITEKLNKINQSNFKGLSFSQIPFEEREKMRIKANSEKENLKQKYPLIIEFDSVYNTYYNSNERNEFIIEEVKTIS
jgi:uncharacterized protein YfkK (UPF0435 family)